MLDFVRTGRLFALAVLLAAAPVRAEDPAPRHATLHYERTPEAEACPEQRELENAVAARLGYMPFSEDASDQLAVRVTRKGERFSATLRLSAAGRKNARVRELGSSGRDCAELAEAVALALSLAIDPLALTRAPAPVIAAPEPVPVPLPPPVVAAPEPPPPPPPAPPPPPPPSAAPAPRDPRELLHGYLALSGAGVLGAEPALVPGMAFALGIRREQLSAGLWLRLDASATQQAFDSAELSAASRVLGADACFVPRWLRACALVGVSSVQADARGFDAAHGGSGLHGLVGARLGAELSLPMQLFARLDLDGYAALGRVRFEVLQRQVWQTSRLQAVLALGIGRYL